MGHKSKEVVAAIEGIAENFNCFS